MQNNNKMHMQTYVKCTLTMIHQTIEAAQKERNVEADLFNVAGDPKRCKENLASQCGCQ